MKDIQEKISFNLNFGEKSYFEKIEEILKQTIFSVLFVLLKKEEPTIFQEFLKVALQYLQLISFSFNPLVKKFFY